MEFHTDSDDLVDVIESIQTTDYGAAWPDPYNEFFRVWGFFNRIYDLLYSGQEWERIAKFSLDTRFQPVWEELQLKSFVHRLAEQPCVGNGRNNYQPSNQVRIAFQTLRSFFGVEVSKPCHSQKCQLRRQRGWVVCSDFDWPELPFEIVTPQDAIFHPLGSLLAIVYQVRNNLFHGSKHEVCGPEYRRNLLLVKASRDIVESILSKSVEVLNMETYGFPSNQWRAAKSEARRAMINAARNETTIYYSDLVQDIEAIDFEPHDFRLFHLLGQVSSEESKQGRGMLTAVVVKLEDGIPGQGFFDLARDLGYDSSDQDGFWVSELRKVFDVWKA